MKNVRAIFMGTPSFAEVILEKLISYLDIVMVVCQPDREKDRHGNYIYSPCKKLALANNIEVFQPLKIREDYQKILDKKPDLIITAAYGQIIPKEILDAPKFGCINVHASLLPRLRGGAPIHHALINGDKVVGVTIMYMDTKMDNGDIIAQKEIPVDDNIILDELYEKLAFLGRDLLIDTLPLLVDGTNKRLKQDESKVTFAYNITKEEEKISFNDTCEHIHNLIRGLSSIPGAYAILKGKRVKIYRSLKTDIPSKKEPGIIEKISSDSIYVNTSDYLLQLLDIQMEGKKRCLVRDFLNGSKKEELIGEKFE